MTPAMIRMTPGIASGTTAIEGIDATLIP